MPIYRARVVTDLIYEAKEPLTAPILARISNRAGMYMRTGATEGLEGRIEVVTTERVRHNHAHHHDATEERCSSCYRSARDGLGPIEDEE